MTEIFTVEASRDFDLPAEVVFAHWMDPDSRRRWETPEGSGMAYAAFDTREGGHEEVVVTSDGRRSGACSPTSASCARARSRWCRAAACSAGRSR